MQWVNLNHIDKLEGYNKEAIQDLRFEIKLLGFEDNADCIRFQIRGTEIKRISIRGISVIPLALSKFGSVKELDIETDILEHLPSHIADMEGLRILKVKARELKEISPELVKFRPQTFRLLVENVIDFPLELVDWFTTIQRFLVYIKTINGARISSLNKFKPLNSVIQQCLINEVPVLAYEKLAIDELEILADKSFTANSDHSEINILDGHITELKLRNLGLNTLPNKLLRLKCIKKLDLSSNQFTEIPVVISKLKSLTELIMNNNKITEIQWGISQIKWLEKLYLRNNAIKEFPETGLLQKRLKELDLTNNMIKHIPKELETYNHLLVLSLYGNPIESFKASSLDTNQQIIIQKEMQHSQWYSSSSWRNFKFVDNESLIVMTPIQRRYRW